MDGGPLVGACGTDDATLLARREALHDLGFTTEVIVEETAYTIDVAYVLGHVYSAMPPTLIPEHRRAEFATGLRHALRHLDAGALRERITATALIARTSVERA